MDEASPQRRPGCWPLVLLVAALGLWALTALLPAVETLPPVAVQPDQRQAEPLAGAPVTLDGRVIVRIENPIDEIDPFQRADQISARLHDLATNPFITPPRLQLIDTAGGIEIRAGDRLVMIITAADAASAGQDQVALATQTADAMQAAVDEGRRVYSVSNRLRALVQVGAVLFTTLLLTWGVGWLFRWLLRLLEQLPKVLPAALRRARVLHSDQWRRAVRAALRIVRLGLVIAIWVVAVPQVLRILPSTAAIGAQLADLVLAPLAGLWEWLSVNLSNFATIGLVAGAAALLIRLSRVFFDEVARGTIAIPGFETAWATYTKHLTAFLVVIAAAIIAFPYIPGSETALFRGIIVFLGVVLTLSANTAIANIVAGVIQVYTGAFQVGDVVKIGELQGIVAEKRLFTTRVRSFKNEEVVRHASRLSHCSTHPFLGTEPAVPSAVPYAVRRQRKAPSKACRQCTRRLRTDGVPVRERPHCQHQAVPGLGLRVWSTHVNARNRRYVSQAKDADWLAPKWHVVGTGSHLCPVMDT